MYGRLHRLAAPLLAALALSAPGAPTGAAPPDDPPDEPPATLEPEPPPTPAPGLPPAAPRDGASPEPRDRRGAGDASDGEPEQPPEPVVPEPVVPAPADAPPAGPGSGAAREDEASGTGPPKRRLGWLDASHGFLEEQLLAPVLRIDRFFSDETELDAERARSFLRWRNEVRFEEDGTVRFATSVRANLRFPAITKALRRLRLVLEGETQDAFSELFPGEGATEDGAPVGKADAELRYRLWDGFLAHADLGAGVLVELPPGAFGRLRLRWAVPAGKLFLTRVALIGFYRTDERLGASTDLHLERPLGGDVLARLSSQLRITQRSPGYEWRSELATFVGLGRRAAGALGVGVNGATRREPVELERVRVFTRLRGDFYRRWLFFEVEPEYSWPYTPERGRHAVWALTTRLEIQFHGRERLPEPEDPEPADPADPPGAGGDAVAPRASAR